MKILFAFLVFVAFQVFGVCYQYNATNSITETFVADYDGSEVGTCPAGSAYLMAYNGTSSVLDWGVGEGTDTIPTAAAGQLPPGSWSDLSGSVQWNGSDAFYVRSNQAGSVTDGYIILQCDGKN